MTLPHFDSVGKSPPVDIPASLLWPWRELASAMTRHADARHRLLAAQTDGRREDVIVASLDQREAEADYHRVREQVAEFWVMGLRIALDLIPATVGDLLDRLPVTPMAADAIEALESRMDRNERLLLKATKGGR